MVYNKGNHEIFDFQDQIFQKREVNSKICFKRFLITPWTLRIQLDSSKTHQTAEIIAYPGGEKLVFSCKSIIFPIGFLYTGYSSKSWFRRDFRVSTALFSRKIARDDFKMPAKHVEITGSSFLNISVATGADTVSEKSKTIENPQNCQLLIEPSIINPPSHCSGGLTSENIF